MLNTLAPTQKEKRKNSQKVLAPLLGKDRLSLVMEINDIPKINGRRIITLAGKLENGLAFDMVGAIEKSEMSDLIWFYPAGGLSGNISFPLSFIVAVENMGLGSWIVRLK